MKVSAIIVAAGEGRRLGGELPKTFLTLAGRAMLLRTLDRLLAADCIEDAVVVVAADQLDRAAEMIGVDADLARLLRTLTAGGETRQRSVALGLAAVAPDTDIVVVHDGARPLASPELFRRCIDGAVAKGAVVAGLPVRDTIKIVDRDRRVQSTPPRAGLWEIQTPQAFRRDVLVEAHAWATAQGIDATDDAMLVEMRGGPVYVVDGERTNLKITLPEDLRIAEMLLNDQPLTG